MGIVVEYANKTATLGEAAKRASDYTLFGQDRTAQSAEETIQVSFGTNQWRQRRFQSLDDQWDELR